MRGAAWIRLRETPVLNPWKGPATWGELREACKGQGLNLDRLLREASKHLRDGSRHALLLGFPIPDRMGEEAWFENFLTACGVYYEPGRIVAFPYDCAVACTFYRQDLFEQLSKDFEAEHGYRMEFTDDTTCDKRADTAAYWQPALYDHGEVVEPSGIAAYYRAAPGVDPARLGPGQGVVACAPG